MAYITTKNMTVGEIITQLRELDEGLTVERTLADGYITFAPKWEIGRQVVSIDDEATFIIGETQNRWKTASGYSISKATHYDSMNCNTGRLFHTTEIKLSSEELAVMQEAMQDAAKQLIED